LVVVVDDNVVSTLAVTAEKSAPNHTLRHQKLVPGCGSWVLDSAMSRRTFRSTNTRHWPAHRDAVGTWTVTVWVNSTLPRTECRHRRRLITLESTGTKRQEFRMNPLDVQQSTIQGCLYRTRKSNVQNASPVANLTSCRLYRLHQFYEQRDRIAANTTPYEWFNFCAIVQQ